MPRTPFFDRLEEIRADRRTTLCVGIDPRLDQIPEVIRKAAGGDAGALLLRFGLEILDLAAPEAACFKPNIAFFEAHGLAGLKAYASILAEARRRGILVIGDVKRGDMGPTATAYAAGHLAPGGDLEVDAVTLNPYLGRDALAPFVDAATGAGKGVYALVRTSNPGAADLQDLAVAPDGRRLYEHVADLVRELGRRSISARTGLSSVGAVVGATSPESARALRARLPDTPFLVPGYGAQGATARDVAVCYRADGSGAVVNASRSVIHPPAPDGDWRAAVVRASRAAKEELHHVAPVGA